uniref:Glycosyltransferase 25 family member-like n=1 Tax=Hirondellea gigas TaxID=1518452 RepID=A0A2P2I1M3_9CRUS
MVSYHTSAALLVSLCWLCTVSSITYKRPTVMVVLLARNKQHTLPYFLTLFERLDYPKHRMALYIRADHCQDKTIPILEVWLSNAGHQYHSLDVHLDRNSSLYPGEISPTDKGDSSYEGIIKLKETALQKARQTWTDYVWFLDVDVFITEPDLINILLEENVAIISPMIDSLGRYSNFWGGMSEEYWYVRTDQYMDILDRKEKGCFLVPMIHSCVLVNLKVMETDLLTFNPDRMLQYELPLDDIIAFAISAREVSLEMTICNEDIYGYMSPPIVEKERADLDLMRLISLKLEVLVNLPPLPVSPLLQQYIPSLPQKDKLGIDQVYLVNLKRRSERRQRMEYSFQELGFDVVALDAVDGQLLNDEKLDELGIQFLSGYKDPWSGRHMTYGEIGCFLSHYNVWKDVVENGHDKVLLFEDDIRFEPFFREHVLNLLMHTESLDLEWDLIYLGRKKLRSADEPLIEGSDRLVHVEYSYWTLCYLLTARGAAKLLAAEPLQRLLPVDEFLPIMFGKHPETDWSAEFSGRDLKAFSVAPLLVFPTHYTGDDGYISDTEESTILPPSSDAEAQSDAHAYSNSTSSPGASGSVNKAGTGVIGKGSRDGQGKGSGEETEPRGPDGLLPSKTPSESLKNLDIAAQFGKDEL